MADLDWISLFEHDRSGRIRYVTHDFEALTVERTIGEVPRLRGRVLDPGLHTLYGRRRTLRFVYADAPNEWWRIETVKRERGGGSPFNVEAVPLWMDLDSQTAHQTLSSGMRLLQVTISGDTAANALARILSADMNCPAIFTAGTVDAALPDSLVWVHGAGATHLELLRKLREELGGAEWEAVWNGSAYEINLMPAVGDQDASNRVVNEIPGAAINRKRLSQEESAKDYFSRLIPIGGSEGEDQTIAKAAWAIDTATYDSGADETTVTFEKELIWQTGALVGARLKGDSGAAYTVTSSTAPDQVTVSLDASAEEIGTFQEADGSDLIALVDDAAETAIGRKERQERFTDVPPYANILAREKVNVNFSLMSGGIPAGWQAVGTPSGALVTSEESVRYGTGSAKITADKGEGIQTPLLPFDPTDTNPVLSAWLSARLESGKIAFELVDESGQEQPPGDEATSTSTYLTGFGLSGMTPSSDKVRLKITAEEDGTVFVLDAITLTQSQSFYEYSPNMGPNALWQRGAKLMQSEGGLTPDYYDGVVFDPAGVSGLSGDSFGMGDRVTMRLDGQAEFTTRIVGVKEQVVEGSSAPKKTITLSRQKKDARGRFAETGRPKLPHGTAKAVTRPTVKATPDQVGATGTLSIAVTDPSGVVGRVQARKASGRNLTGADTWTTLVESGGTYDVDVALKEKHTSHIEYRVQSSGPVDDIKGHHAYDLDTRAEASYSLTHYFDAGAGGVLAKVVCRGDEDTASFVSVFNDGANTETITENGRQVTITVNPSYPLDAGDTCSITVTAYPESGGTGQAEAEPFSETIEIPVLKGTASSDGYTKSEADTRFLNYDQPETITAGYNFTTAPTINSNAIWHEGNDDPIAFRAESETITGGWTFDALAQFGGDVLPVQNYASNLGSSTKKWLTLHAAELRVETIVSQERRITAGGRFTTGYSTTLPNFLSTTRGQVNVKHNILNPPDVLHLEKEGQIEFMTVTAYNVTFVSTANDYFRLSGDWTQEIEAGDTFYIGSGGNSGTWTVTTVGYSSSNDWTNISVQEDVTSSDASGNILYFDKGENGYLYDVVRNVDSSGANEWLEGDAVFNTGSPGDGFIDQYARWSLTQIDRSEGNIDGPAISFMERTGTGHADISTRGILGNLKGNYDYVSKIYGAAFGDYANNWIGIDPTDGLRMMHAQQVLAQLSAGVFEVGASDAAGDGFMRYTEGGGLDVQGTITVTGGSGIGAFSDAGVLAQLDQADWASHITGSGKPANNADVTADNTAAGISNQGAFATLDKITSANNTTYIGSDAIVTDMIVADVTLTNALLANSASITNTLTMGANAEIRNSAGDYSLTDAGYEMGVAGSYAGGRAITWVGLYGESRAYVTEANISGTGTIHTLHFVNNVGAASADERNIRIRVEGGADIGITNDVVEMNGGDMLMNGNHVTVCHTGTGAPSSSLGKVGDIYNATDLTAIYIKDDQDNWRLIYS